MKRALIVSKSTENGQMLSHYIDGKIYADIQTVCSSQEAKSRLSEYDYDIIIINTPVADESGIELAKYIAQNTASGILLIVKQELYDKITDIVCDFGILTAARPIKKAEFEAKLRFTAANTKRFYSLKQENEKLKTKMDEMQLVNRAKSVLIKYLSISEEQAYRYIAKQAMDMRIPKTEVARRILNAYES